VTDMIFPSITAFYGAILALILVAMSVWVIAGRLGKQTLFGDAGDDAMMRRVRSHANFVEYVPFAVLLIALLEASGASPGLVRTLLVVLIVARLLHPIGMLAKANTPPQFACRGGGTIATLVVILVTAVALLIRV
jgi:uncharacterized membrane protein YecN with MAPEG domain